MSSNVTNMLDLLNVESENSSLKNPSLHTLHRSIVTIYVGSEKYEFYFHKGRLCQHSSFFEKAFHGSFEEASTGSMYLEEEGVEEIKIFEEWLYSQELKYPEDSDDPSLLLVKVFCFAEKVGILSLQNAALDAIRDRATGQLSSQRTTIGTSIEQEIDAVDVDPPANYLLPATSGAIKYAYQNTPEGSSLRKLLADIFAYNVKPETLDEDILSFPNEFMADVLLINMKRLPLRLKNETADFDENTDKYHVQKYPESRPDKKKGAEAAGNLDDVWGALGGLPSVGKSRNKKGKKVIA